MLNTQTDSASTPATRSTPAAPRRRAIENALLNIRASITVLDDEAIAVFGWECREEVIQNLREAVHELRKL